LRSVLLAISLLVALPGCELSVGDGDGDGGQRMGSGNVCHRRLSAIVDESYLESQGLEIKPGQEDAATIQVGGAIAEVCREGPADLSVDDGAERVVDIVRARHTS
jgi:hypothetical protein